MTTPLLLGVIALVLAQPLPAVLARQEWPYRAPRAAVVLWQALALAAILAMVGAGLSAALWLVVHEGAADPDPGAGRVALHVLFLGLTLVVVIRTAVAAAQVGREVSAVRRRQRTVVDLVGSRGALGRSVRILDASEPLAYCLPGARSRVVLTRGALSSLSDTEVEAVLAHERAHLRARHDLVVDAFCVLHRAFPRVLRSEAALTSTRVLVEMLADDRARRCAGRVELARALVKLGSHPAPQGALGASSALSRRIARIELEPTGRTEALACYAIAAVVLVGPTVTLALPWVLTAWATLA